jgi:hypothetical protein
MSGKRKDADVLRTIDDRALDDLSDEMESMSNEELEALIASEGGDAAGMRARGEAQGEKLLDRRARLAWTKAAQARIDRVQAMAKEPRVRENLPRAELLARIESARNHPKLAAPIAIAFRKRTADDSSDEELHALLEEIELLRKAIDEGS